MNRKKRFGFSSTATTSLNSNNLKDLNKDKNIFDCKSEKKIKTNEFKWEAEHKENDLENVKIEFKVNLGENNKN